MNQLVIPHWIIPLVLLIVLLGLYPQVSEWDAERKVDSAVTSMRSDLDVENKTDGQANEVALIETKINELLANTGGKITLNRSGNIHYSQHEDGEDYEADFYVTAMSYFVSDDSIKGECQGEPCVTLSNKGVFDDEKVQMDYVYILLQSAEQGDKLVQLLQQFEQICDSDTEIDTGIKRKWKRIWDKIV